MQLCRFYDLIFLSPPPGLRYAGLRFLLQDHNHGPRPAHPRRYPSKASFSAPPAQYYRSCQFFCVWSAGSSRSRVSKGKRRHSYAVTVSPWMTFEVRLTVPSLCWLHSLDALRAPIQEAAQEIKNLQEDIKSAEHRLVALRIRQSSRLFSDDEERPGLIPLVLRVSGILP